MRKSVWIILTAVFVAIAAPNAHADTFTATFTCTQAGGCSFLPTALAVSFPSPTSITETWGPFVGTIPLPAPTSPLDSWSWANQVLSNGSARLCVRDLSLGPEPQIFCALVSGLDSVFASDIGALAFVAIPPPSSVPEPSSVALMLFGIGLVFVMRKRIGQGLPQAN